MDCTKISSDTLTYLPKLQVVTKTLEIKKCQNLIKIEEFDKKIIKLSISHNKKLTSLPKLPDKLNLLLCQNNKLTSLPKLPDDLKILSCDYNKLTSLPKLPVGTMVYCSHKIKFLNRQVT
jgi:Leucine-rich repeat (LRR) protein